MSDSYVIFAVSLISLLYFVKAQDGTGQQSEPDWTLLLVVFIVSSAIAAMIGVVALVKKPNIPDLPDIRKPSFSRRASGISRRGFQESNEASRTMYKQHPINNGPDSYPMETMRSTRSDHSAIQQYPMPVIASAQNAQQESFRESYQQSYQPVTVMTQRM